MNIDTVFTTKSFCKHSHFNARSRLDSKTKYATIDIEGAAKDLEDLRAEQITILVEKIEPQDESKVLK